MYKKQKKQLKENEKEKKKKQGMECWFPKCGLVILLKRC